MIQGLVASLERYPEAGYVYSDFWLINDKGQIIEEYKGKGPRYGTRRTIYGNGGVSAFLYTRDVFNVVGNYSTDLEGVEGNKRNFFIIFFLFF